jgi:hypothetical protein
MATSGTPLCAISIACAWRNWCGAKRRRTEAAAATRRSCLRALMLRQARQPLSNGGLARGQAFDSGEQVGERQLAGGMLELLTRQLAAVLDRPRRRLRIDAAVAKQHLRDGVAGGHQVASAGIMSTHQLACRAGRKAAWQQAGEALAEFDGADGFIGPCELLVGAATR